MRESLGAETPLKTIELEFLDNGKDAAPALATVSLPLDAEDERILAELESLLGQKVRINVRHQTGLGISLKKEVSNEAIASAAKVLSRYRYGGWEKIEVNVAGRFHTFDGKGTAK